MRRRWFVLFVVVVLGIGAWLVLRTLNTPIVSGEYRPDEPPLSFSATEVVKDDRPSLRINAGQPWELHFGRGSGWHGLNTLSLDHDGYLQLQRHGVGTREPEASEHMTAAGQLSQADVANVLRALEETRVLELERAYHAGVHDGTQWILWVQQGDREKSVYFDNHFPDSVVQFAGRLDAIVASGSGAGLEWRPTPKGARTPERDLWESIKR